MIKSEKIIRHKKSIEKYSLLDNNSFLNTLFWVAIAFLFKLISICDQIFIRDIFKLWDKLLYLVALPPNKILNIIKTNDAYRSLGHTPTQPAPPSEMSEVQPSLCSCGC